MSAAEAFKDRLTVILLDGMALETAPNMLAVKNFGATVIAEKPADDHAVELPTRRYAVAGAADIGQVVGDRAKAGTGRRALTHILDRATAQAGVDFHTYRRSTLLRRITRRMVAIKVPTLAAYALYLDTHPEEVGALASGFLINVTRFFRDLEMYAYLRDEVLPEIIAHERSANRTLRIWSAGCATGEEAYSIAMLLADMLGPELPQWSIKIFATDVDMEALAFGRRGMYCPGLMADLPEGYRERFFTESAGRYHITANLRKTVVFGFHDMSRSAPFPHISIALCRNVLMYFTPDVQENVLRRLTYALCPDQGYLVLGKAERVPSNLPYSLVNRQWRTYRCTGTSEVTLPAARRIEQQPATAPGTARPIGERVLRELAVGVVVLDQHYRILQVNHSARRALELTDVSGTPDFLHSVHGLPYMEVRTAIDRVFHTHTPETLTEVRRDGSERVLSFAIAPLRAEDGESELVTISITDVTSWVQTRRALETSQTAHTRLVQELTDANRQLNDRNAALGEMAATLEISNEQLILTHEELQTALEEFETTTEELQTTNEELETANEESQAMNEELQATNDELEARSQEMAVALAAGETARARMAEMIENAPFQIIVARGSQLRIEAMNAGSTHIGQILPDAATAIWGDAGETVVALAHHAYHSNTTQSADSVPHYATDAQGKRRLNYVDYRFVPTHTQKGTVTGVILYASDATARQMRVELERLQMIFDYVTQVALALYDAEFGPPAHCQPPVSGYG